MSLEHSTLGALFLRFGARPFFLGVEKVRVLITGGTGTFGNAIVPLLLSDPEIERITILSRDEQKQAAMSAKFNSDRLNFFLGDVRDLDRLKMAVQGHNTVLHAAALKIVHACEFDPFEAVKTNVHGTENLIKACLHCGVAKAILISTDKACNPINLYGATKMTAEKLFLAANNYNYVESINMFSVVRYGNVTGSRGSVIPAWREQAKRGERIKITDPLMRRFALEPTRATQFVIEVMRIMQGREIFVPKMWHYGILQLFSMFNAVTGLGAQYDVTGVRPGEKIIETAITEDEINYTWNRGDYFLIHPMSWNINPPLREAYTSNSDGYQLDMDYLRNHVTHSI